MAGTGGAGEPARSRPLWRGSLRPVWQLLHPVRGLANRLLASAKRLAWKARSLSGQLGDSFLRPRYRCVSLGGPRLYVDVKDPLIGAALAAHLPYEPHVAAAVTAALRPGDTFLDIGANMGYFTILAASRVGPCGRVIAFEPRQDNVALLLLSARENGFGHVAVYPFAVAEREQVFKYFPSEENSLSCVLEASRVEEGGIPVRAVALDEVLAGLPRLDVVKIDIDGNEPRALAGMRGLLRRHRPVLFFEYAPVCIEQVSGSAPEALLEEILALGYDIRTLEQGGPGGPPQRVPEIQAAYDRSGSTHIDLVAFPAGAGAAKAA